MKKFKQASLMVILAGTLCMQSCATIFGGHITKCQTTKPAAGQPKRQIRPVPLVLDIFSGFIWLGVDFLDGAIYKPCSGKKSK